MGYSKCSALQNILRRDLANVNARKNVFLTVPRRYFFCGSFMGFFFGLYFVLPLYAFVYLCLVVTCWERADLLAIVCLTVSLSLSHWYRGSGVVLDCIDS